MDTWILVAVAEEERKRNRWLYVLKSRGMPHSNERARVRYRSTEPASNITARHEPAHRATARQARGNANERKLTR